MSVIQALGARVEREHSQHLREVRKMEEQTATMNVSNGDNPFDFSGQSQEVDFETLVKGGAPSASTQAAASTDDPWDMDNWGNDDLVSIAPLFPAHGRTLFPALVLLRRCPRLRSADHRLARSHRSHAARRRHRARVRARAPRGWVRGRCRRRRLTAQRLSRRNRPRSRLCNRSPRHSRRCSRRARRCQRCRRHRNDQRPNRLSRLPRPAGRTTTSPCLR